MDHFRYIKIHTWLQTKEMYHSFLSLKMISFDFDDFFQASQPSTVKPHLTATFFGRLAKTATQIFFSKTKRPSLIRLPR